MQRGRKQSGARSNKISPLMFYSWYLFQHQIEFMGFLRSSKLMRQYVIDQFLREKQKRCRTLKLMKCSYDRRTKVDCKNCFGNFCRKECERSVFTSKDCSFLYRQRLLESNIAPSNARYYGDFEQKRTFRLLRNSNLQSKLARDLKSAVPGTNTTG